MAPLRIEALAPLNRPCSGLMRHGGREGATLIMRIRVFLARNCPAANVRFITQPLTLQLGP
jgi:hypothetical protein